MAKKKQRNAVRKRKPKTKVPRWEWGGFYGPLKYAQARCGILTKHLGHADLIAEVEYAAGLYLASVENDKAKPGKESIKKQLERIQSQAQAMLDCMALDEPAENCLMSVGDDAGITYGRLVNDLRARLSRFQMMAVRAISELATMGAPTKETEWIFLNTLGCIWNKAHGYFPWRKGRGRKAFESFVDSATDPFPADARLEFGKRYIRTFLDQKSTLTPRITN